MSESDSTGTALGEFRELLLEIRSRISETPGDVLTPDEAARFLSISPRTLRAWHAAGAGPRRCSLPGGLVRFRKADLLAWLERCTGSDGEPRRRLRSVRGGRR